MDGTGMTRRFGFKIHAYCRVRVLACSIMVFVLSRFLPQDLRAQLYTL